MKKTGDKNKFYKIFFISLTFIILGSIFVLSTTSITDTGITTQNLSYNGGRLGLGSSSGVILGDSTIAAYLGQNGIDYYLLQPSDILAGTTINNLAVPGENISQQLARWENDVNKSDYDWIIIDLGLNDLHIGQTISSISTRYQNMINSINLEKKSSAIIIVATMTPNRQSLINAYGSIDGNTLNDIWKGVNDVIMNNITGVSYRINKHTLALDNGLNNLSYIYDMGDGVHETNEGRKIIASAYREILNQAGFLTSVSSLTIDNYFGSNNTFTYLKDGYLGIGTKNPVQILDVNGTVHSSAMIIQKSAGSDSLLNGPFLDLTNVDGSAGGLLQLSTSNNLDIWMNNGGWSRVSTFTKEGNVGIGTISPQQTLSVVGNMNVTTNVTIGTLLTLTPIILPSCTTITNHTFAVNNSGLYYCNSTQSWTLIVAG